jgi:hypothetical protein
MTLKEFTNFFNENEFLRAYFIALILYILIVIPKSEEDFQPAIIKGIWIVFIGVSLIWIIGNYDVVFRSLGF